MQMSALTLLGCGDVGPIHPPMSEYTAFVMEWVSEDFDHRFRVEGDEIVVESAAPQ
jgi:hypothetical protein